MIDVNFHKDFMANTPSDFFHGQADKVLFYWPNHSRETKKPSSFFKFRISIYYFHMKASVPLK